MAGYDKLISREEFDHASNGYLIDDTCVFGAEVFVCKERRTGKREFASLNKNAVTYYHVWKVENFSMLDDQFYESEPLMVGEHKWYDLHKPSY